MALEIQHHGVLTGWDHRLPVYPCFRALLSLSPHKAWLAPVAVAETKTAQHLNCSTGGGGGGEGTQAILIELMHAHYRKRSRPCSVFLFFLPSTDSIHKSAPRLASVDHSHPHPRHRNDLQGEDAQVA